MSFKLGKSSLKKLEGIDADLVSVVKKAITITEIDFTVVEGLRTAERQARLLASGASKTLNSRHITGHAVDLAPWVDGKTPWKDLEAFKKVSSAMFQAADELGVLIQWGGDWDLDGDSSDESYLDMPHWQIPWPYRVESAKSAMQLRIKTRMLSKRDTDPAPTLTLEQRVERLEKQVFG